MIPDIGIIIGAYVITKMVSVFYEGKEPHEKSLPKLLAIATIIITLASLADLFSKAHTVTGF